MLDHQENSLALYFIFIINETNICLYNYDVCQFHYNGFTSRASRCIFFAVFAFKNFFNAKTARFYAMHAKKSRSILFLDSFLFTKLQIATVQNLRFIDLL
jgi:hypothetical protein